MFIAHIKASQFAEDQDQWHPQQMEFFKKMIREFSMTERQMLLKFITGSSRLNSGRTINVQFQT